MTNVSNIIRTATRAATIFAMSFMAFAIVFTTVETAAPNTAYAASKTKKAKKGLQFTGKAFNALKKAGEKAQKKRGITKGLGKAMTNIGKGGSKASKGMSKGIGKASKGVNKFMSKSKTGRSIQKSFKKAGQAQNKAINKAFKICNGKVCDAAKGGAKFIAPF